MFEQLIAWTGGKAARSCIRFSRFMVRKMRKDARELAIKGQTATACNISKVADDLELMIQSSEKVLAKC